MNRAEAEKELWSLANGITAFSVTQSLAVAIALGTTLRKPLQCIVTTEKMWIAGFALAYAALYCSAVFRCRILSRTLGSELEAIWRETTIGRVIAIGAGVGVFLFGLFAPQLFGK